MIIKFDNTIINNNYVMGLNKEGALFNGTFKLGSTVCETVRLTIDATGIGSIPTTVTIDGIDYIVDSYTIVNTNYYQFSLTDRMILLNENYQIDIDTPKTIRQLVDDICDTYSITAPATFLYEDNVVNWTGDEYLTARDFIGFVAEINGGFAKLVNNQLVFATFSYNGYDISLDSCADFELGDYHRFSQVTWDGGVTVGDDTYSTYTVDSYNILIDSSNATQVCTTILNNLPTFYNVKVSRCEFDSNSISIGDVIKIGGYPTIAQIDWYYNVGWAGGFELNLNDEEQVETVVESTNDVVKYLRFNLNRAENKITSLVQSTNELENTVTEVQQNANQLAIKIQNGVDKVSNELVVVDENGITVSNDTAEVTSTLDADGLEINNKSGELIASFKNDGVNTPRLESAKAVIGGLVIKLGAAYWVGGNE